MAGESLSTLMQCRPFGRDAKDRFGAVPSAWAQTRVGTRTGNRCLRKNTRSERGVTLIETMVAAAILITAVIGVLPVVILGSQTTAQQGDVATRTTEYAQDKMESLLNLDFNDAATNTTVFPPSPTGGTGLGGTMAANANAGAIPPTAALAGYVDYLDGSGNLLVSSAGAYYTRQWRISTDATATLKTITVVVTSLQAAGVQGLAPSTTLVCIKSSGL
jgi:type II secretory pathway pseudopilin PulG